MACIYYHSKKIAASDRGLSGSIGADLIIDRDGITVVAIKPGLRTAYAGLRSSIALDPAVLIPAILKNKSFRADYDIKQRLAIDSHLQ